MDPILESKHSPRRLLRAGLNQGIGSGIWELRSGIWDPPFTESSEELLEILRLEWSPSVWSVRTCYYHCYCAVLL